MTTTIVHIEHPVLDFDTWKRTFDSDPINRRRSGVRRYRIVRAADDPSFVTIDLEFDDARAAERTLAALQNLWQNGMDGVLVIGPRARVFDIVEVQEV